MNLKFFKTAAIFIMLTGCFIACSTSKDVIDDVEEIDMSSIDFSNIENLFAQPLPVIQKCMEGGWEVIRIQHSWYGDSIARNGEYLFLTRERIIIGNIDTVLTDSPIIWEKFEKYYDFPTAHCIAFNVKKDENQTVLYTDYLFPYFIRSDTLVVWDLHRDGQTLFLTRNNETH